MRSISPFEQFGEPIPAEEVTLKRHAFNSTETITGVAHIYYGDWQLWRLIADRSGVVDPRNIEPGTVLLIPDKPLERGSESE